ncbi:hypothetical protein LOK49_Contig363G00005 [Camellia lanceoleosa]|nr:hypothetical protein LOK49_Contig363G00005 [Camellia lanceoleosa]
MMFWSNSNGGCRFYTECLGMKLLRKRDIPEEGYTNAFLGYGPEDSHFVIELTYNYGVDNYDIGTGLVILVAKTVDLIKAKGGKLPEPGPVKGGSTALCSLKILMAAMELLRNEITLSTSCDSETKLLLAASKLQRKSC